MKRTNDPLNDEANHVADVIEHACGPYKIAAVYLGLAKVIARSSKKAERPDANELADLIKWFAQSEFEDSAA
jgi:hypothetical protein